MDENYIKSRTLDNLQSFDSGPSTEADEEGDVFDDVIPDEEADPDAPTLHSQDSTSSQSGISGSSSQSGSRKRSRSSSGPLSHEVQDVVSELQRIADSCQPKPGNEYDSFCESLAIQLKLMPAEYALRCQARPQKVMTAERLAQLKSEEPLCICGARCPEGC